MREEVVTSKIALVRSRIALAKKLGAEAGGGDKARKHGASEAEQLLATQARSSICLRALCDVGFCAGVSRHRAPCALCDARTGKAHGAVYLRGVRY